MRLGLGLAALTWCLAIVSDAVHPVVVRHVICMEHGELLDAPEPVAHGHDTAVSEAPGGAHDPCEVDGSSPVVPRGWAPPRAWIALAPEVGPGHAEAAHPPLAALASAPKTSPPRV